MTKKFKAGDKVRVNDRAATAEGLEGEVTGYNENGHVTLTVTKAHGGIDEAYDYKNQVGVTRNEWESILDLIEPVSQYKVGDLVTFNGNGNEKWDGGKGRVIRIDPKPNKYPVRVEVLEGPPLNNYYLTGEGRCGDFNDSWLKPWVGESKPAIAPHYAAGMPEGIDALAIMSKQGWEKKFLLGSILKYITRCEHKGQYLSDLKKIQDYAGKLIAIEEA